MEDIVGTNENKPICACRYFSIAKARVIRSSNDCFAKDIAINKLFA